MSEYQRAKRQGEGAVTVESLLYGNSIWNRLRLRNAASCHICKKTLGKGDQAYVPATSGWNRNHRMCTGCIGDLLRK